jgi:K+-transporting ATPase KdpF subunit
MRPPNLNPSLTDPVLEFYPLQQQATPHGADTGEIPMTLTEITNWLGALGALAVFVYLGYALLRPEQF